MSTPKILGGVLAAQLALVAVTWWPRHADVVVARELVPGGGNSITALEIVGSSADAQPVRLESKDGHWTVASAHGYPADDEKVGEVLDALGKIKLKEPIATQAASAEALGVSDAKFERKVTITTASGPVTFLVGSAKSKAIHLRPVGTDEVYEVKGLSAWTLKDAAKGYLPSNYVDLDKTTLTAVTITNAHGTIALTKGENGWTLGDGTAANASAVDKLLDGVAKVRLGEVVGTEVTPEEGLTSGAVRVSWTSHVGDTDTTGGFVVGAEKAPNHYVKADASPFVVLAPSFKLKDLVDAEASKLVGGAEADAEGPGGMPQGLPPGMMQGLPQGY